MVDIRMLAVMRRVICILFFLTNILGCGNGNKEITTSTEYAHGELKGTYQYRLQKNSDNGITKTILSHTENPVGTVTWTLITYPSFDSINFLNLNCPLIHQISFGQKKIYKYRYDEENGMDEEFDIYLSEENELIATKSLAWDQFELFDIDSSYHDYLLNDSTKFFKLNYKFEYL